MCFECLFYESSCGYWYLVEQGLLQRKERPEVRVCAWAFTFAGCSGCWMLQVPARAALKPENKASRCCDQQTGGRSLTERSGVRLRVWRLLRTASTASLLPPSGVLQLLKEISAFPTIQLKCFLFSPTWLNLIYQPFTAEMGQKLLLLSRVPEVWSWWSSRGLSSWKPSLWFEGLEKAVAFKFNGNNWKNHNWIFTYFTVFQVHTWSLFY